MRFLRLALAGALLVAGCSTAPLVPSQAPSPPAAPAPAPEAVSAPTSLTERLLALPQASATPLYRWPEPPAGAGYHPLPGGLLLTWTGREAATFTIAATGTDGKQVWTRTYAVPAVDVRAVSISASGRHAALAERSGTVHVLTTADGLEQATLDVGLVRAAFDMTLADDGRFVAVTDRTPSAVFPWGISLYPTSGDTQTRYGATGRAIHASPYHDGAGVRRSAGRRGLADAGGRSGVHSIPP